MRIIKHNTLDYRKIHFTEKYVFFMRDFYFEKYLFIYENKNQQRHGVAKLFQLHDRIGFLVTSNRRDESLLALAQHLFKTLDANVWYESPTLDVSDFLSCEIFNVEIKL